MCLTLQSHGLQPIGSSVHGLFQARVVEWVATSFSRGSSWPRDQTQVLHIAGRRFTIWATREFQYLIIWYFIVLSLIQCWLSSQPFRVHHSFLLVGDDCLHFCAFSQEVFLFQNVAWTNFLASEGTAEVCYNEKKNHLQHSFFGSTRTWGFIGFRWRKPGHKLFHRRIIPEAMKKIQ